MNRNECLDTIKTKENVTDMLEKDMIEAANRYRDRIFAIAYNYLKNSYDADDITQNVLMKYYCSEKIFESEEHRRNWLIRVAVNECKKLLFSPWRSRCQNLEEYADTLQFEDKEQSELFTAVMSLSKNYRIVVHLYYYEDYSIREIAQILKIRETAVSTRLLRARKMLKEQLQEVWDEEQ